MKRSIWQSVLCLGAIVAGAMVNTVTAASTSSTDPLAVWRDRGTIRPVLPDERGHSLHTYFGISPESPDGRRVVAFTSDRPDAQVGQLVVVERATGQKKVLDASVEVEDGHRQANQQWICGGRYVVYMTLVEGEWLIVRVDPLDLSRQVLAKGRQLGWGQPHLDVVPLYGPHWNPGPYRDFEMLNVRTGEIHVALTAEKAVADHRDFANDRLGGRDRVISIFFPTLSPDGRRAFFKLSTPKDGKFRSGGASDREGLFVYDVANGRAVGWKPSWGHPAWHADSRHIQDLQNVFDCETGEQRKVLQFTPFGGAHPSVRADGRVLVSDVRKKDYLPKRDHWTILLADMADGHHHYLHIAPVEGDGTRSWRPAHPHPSFNLKGNRIYFNVPTGEWTVLYVAEIPE